MKVNIIYWSGTGNTQMMSEAVAEGAEGAGAQVSVIPVAAADSSSVDADVVALGCPAMGAESLEDGEFEPWYASIKPRLAGKGSHSSALMTGATANGCATGRQTSRVQAA